MKLNKISIAAGTLALALGVTPFSVEAAQRSNPRDGNGGQQGQARARSGEERNQGREQSRGSDNQTREQSGDNRDQARQPSRDNRNQSARAPERRDNDNNNYQNDRRSDQRGGVREQRRDNRPSDRVYSPLYRQPRIIRRPAPRHRFGSGGNLSVYFGLGNGYRYGSPYSGRVYGYSGPTVYGTRRYYGDVRLQVRPRDAAVYVDGYYAGIVDQFDGIFQRLTLEVGPHQIEIEAPGVGSRLFEVYVDPSHTVDLHGDLFDQRPDQQDR